jgi:hypothetical protein
VTSDTTTIRPDGELRDLNVNAVIAAGMAADESARRTLFTAGAITASLRLEELGVGPHPVRFLARYVRAAGRAEALALPEPLVGAEAVVLARQWLTAASTVDTGVAGDRAFAQWLDMVAALIAIRRRAR